jgi:acyl-coenzyme A synthetase/AMP-(fatty) acid ligase
MSAIKRAAAVRFAGATIILVVDTGATRMHVVDMVFHWARIDPHRPAIVLPELVTSFAGLADAIDSISYRIDQLGLDPREPVATAIANPALSTAVMFALVRSGFSVAPANRALIKHLQPNGLQNLIYDVEGFVASGGRNIRFDNSWLPAAASTSGSRVFWRRPVGDVSTIFFTSGTTGLPKKFVQSRRGLDEHVALRITADATRRSVLIVPGVVNSFGFNRTCEILLSGKTACYAATREAMLQLIGLFRIDTIVASPQQALGLAAVKESRPDLPVDSLQTIILGGATIGREGIRRIRAALCRTVINSYSSTEGGCAALAPFELIEGIAGAVGFVAPWADVEIVDPDGNPVPNGHDGIIRYRTPRFLANVSPNGDTGTDHWFYPGDMGHLTDDGILCLAGRTSDIINIGGVKVSAKRIEEALESLEEVREAAACGVEDATGVERLWVAVVTNGAVNADALKGKAQAHSDIGDNLNELFVVPELPRGELGKVQKPQLKELLLGLSRRA